MDLLSNYILQREELLARIAQELQLDKTRLERMESAYEAVYKLFENDTGFFSNIEVELYSQGSKRIGTTVKPIKNDDFDLDTVLHTYNLYTNYTPEFIYNELLRVIENNDYYKSILEKKSRCIRLNYKGDFHMDILPACMWQISDREKIAIPEKSRKKWSSGNPKGFAEWFLKIANSLKKSLLQSYSKTLIESKVESEPLPEELYIKTPLQRAVQLIKRYRDIYYQNSSNPVSSIVLTTLIARFYSGEESIFETIDNITTKIQKSYNEATNAMQRFKVLNPVDINEDFTDTWTDQDYISFADFINDFHRRWQKLKESFETSKEEYITLFGEGIYKKSLQEQIKAFSNSSRNPISKVSGLVIGNSAYTDSRGNINSKQGTKNEPHHSYGD